MAAAVIVPGFRIKSARVKRVAVRCCKVLRLPIDLTVDGFRVRVRSQHALVRVKVECCVHDCGSICQWLGYNTASGYELGVHNSAELYRAQFCTGDTNAWSHEPGPR